MEQVMSYEQEQKIIARAIGIAVQALDNKGIITNYSQSLERALVKALAENSRQRKELRRLNQSVRHINALESQVRELTSDVVILEDLLDREDQENNDTDPAPAPTKTEIEKIYNDWDMATRYPNLVPRIFSANGAVG